MTLCCLGDEGAGMCRRAFGDFGVGGGWCVDVPFGLSYKTSGGEESAGTQVGPETTAKC